MKLENCALCPPEGESFSANSSLCRHAAARFPLARR